MRKTSYKSKAHLSRRLVAVLGACALAVGLASCGGEAELDGAAGAVPANAVATLVANQGFTNFVGDIAPKTAGAIAPPGLGGGVLTLDGEPEGGRVGGLVAALYLPCTSVTGSETDGVDNDGVPASYGLTYNCQGVTDNAASRTRLGTYKATDEDDTAYGILAGFKFEWDVTDKGTYFTGRQYESIYRGLYEATTTSSSVSLKGDYTLSTGEDLEDPSKATTLAWKSKHTTTYTPTDMDQPFQTGSISISGFYKVAGVMTPQGQTTPRYELEVAFEVSSSNLTYQNGQLQDGTLTFKDGSGNQIVYTYQAGVVTKQFNGQNL